MYLYKFHEKAPYQSKDWGLFLCFLYLLACYILSGIKYVITSLKVTIQGVRFLGDGVYICEIVKV